jgi:hypothetical protein
VIWRRRGRQIVEKASFTLLQIIRNLGGYAPINIAA